MAYNKAKAEREWIRWKEAEEKKLRELGVDEETIQRLHTYDWAQFNKERQYRQRQVEWLPCGLGRSTGAGAADGGHRIPAEQHRGHRAAADPFQSRSGCSTYRDDRGRGNALI